MSSTIVNLTALIAASILLQLSTGTLVVVGISGSTATVNNDGSSVGVAQVGYEKLGLTSGDDTLDLLKIISSRLDQIEIQLGLAHPDRVCHGFGKAADDRCTRVGNGGGSGGNRIGVEMEDNQDGDAADDDYRAPDLDGSPSRVGQRRRRRHQAGRLEQRRDRSLQGGRRPARSPRGGGEPVAGGRAGLDGRPGVDGAPGLDGVPGVDGRNGRDGLDGRDGKDGKDGQPGERGPIGPPGPPGEAGRRGKSGPPGRPGLPGPPGVCVHRAKFDCARLTTASSNSSSEPLEALLMAPTMIGSQESDSLAGLRRQVSVSEGETIQLTCEAFGLPKPKYVWRRLDSRKSILQMETSSGQLIRLTSFQGAQLPLDQVDRIHMGTYECLASNGVPPEAQKRINLDVNYKPTVRIYPGPSIYRVPLGSSLTVECLVESNPSPFSYWTFGSQSIMATAPPVENKLEQLQAAAKGKYVVMESAGQLANGATYTLLSLNITRIEPNDLGLYKCVSKNLIGQTMGYFWLLESESTPMSVMVAGQADDIKDMMELTLTNTRPFHQLDLELGWPSELVRLHTNYSVFGDELRPWRRQWRAGTVDSQPPAAVQILPSSQANETREPIVNNNQLATFVAPNQLEGSRDDEADLGFDEHSSDDELCHVEKPQTIIQELDLGGRHSKDSSQVLLLDQLGKQVYLGSGPVNWWSMDSMLEDKNGFYYATFSNQSSRLFEYKSLEDLLAEGQRHDLDQTRAQRSYRLEYPLSGSSHLVYNGLFLYQSTGNESDLMVVVLELNGGRQRLLRLAEMMRSQLSLEQKLDRVEMMADENGVWLVVPTLIRRRRLDAPVRNDMIEGGTWTRSRRLNVFKLRLESLLTIIGDHDADRTGDHVNKSLDNLVEYHVSMRLDWRMIGQMFIIDGVLYGIKDRHIYSSKLQLAYDLYKCKLLSTNYLNEPYRFFTNNFGNTQSIKYNPKQPKRLFIIDNANLLWCPVKLVKTDTNEIWHQSPTIVADQKLST